MPRQRRPVLTAAEQKVLATLRSLVSDRIPTLIMLEDWRTRAGTLFPEDNALSSIINNGSKRRKVNRHYMADAQNPMVPVAQSFIREFRARSSLNIFLAEMEFSVARRHVAGRGRPIQGYVIFPGGTEAYALLQAWKERDRKVALGVVEKKVAALIIMNPELRLALGRVQRNFRRLLN